MAKTKAPAGFEHIHYILGGALQQLERELWPARVHLGGPIPVLSLNAQLRVAAAIAAQARVLAPPPDVAAFDQLAALAGPAGSEAERPALEALSKGRKSDPLGMKVARLVARAMYNFRFAAASARNTTGKCVMNAAVALVREIAAVDARAFVQALDDAIVLQELRDRLADRRIEPSSPLARVISRPAGGRSIGLALAQLADGSFGLLVKLKNAWQWHEGDRATVFATVPDAFMDQVAADLEAAGPG